MSSAIYNQDYFNSPLEAKPTPSTPWFRGLASITQTTLEPTPPMEPRPAPALHWCFTLNNPTIDETEVAERLETLGTTYIVYQLEEGEQGTPHFQGYVVLQRKMRLNQLTPVFDGLAHWENARGTPEQNRAYCTKAEGRIGDFCELGELPPPKGARTDLVALQSALDNGLTNSDYATQFFPLFARYPDLPARYASAKRLPRSPEEEIRCFFLIGRPGLGKSRLASLLAQHLAGLGGGVYRHFNTKWFDGYGGERVVIFDDFRGSSLPFTSFKRVVDRYPVRVELKGSTCEMVATCFIFTSNTEPDTWWKDEVTHAEYDAIYRRLGKTLYFPGPSRVSVYSTYRDYARVHCVPLRENEALPVQEEKEILWETPEALLQEICD